MQVITSFLLLMRSGRYMKVRMTMAPYMPYPFWSARLCLFPRSWLSCNELCLQCMKITDEGATITIIHTLGFEGIYWHCASFHSNSIPLTEPRRSTAYQRLNIATIPPSPTPTIYSPFLENPTSLTVLPLGMSCV